MQRPSKATHRLTIYGSKENCIKGRKASICVVAQEEDHEPSQFIQVTTPPRPFSEGFLVHTQNDRDGWSKINSETP